MTAGISRCWRLPQCLFDKLELCAHFVSSATPGEPYGNTTESLLQVELNMETRCACWTQASPRSLLLLRRPLLVLALSASALDLCVRARGLCARPRLLSRRRRRIQAVLGDNESPLSIVAFPLLGVGDFTFPSTTPGVYLTIFCRVVVESWSLCRWLVCRWFGVPTCSGRTVRVCVMWL